MSARKSRPAPTKRTRRKPKLDERERALVELYFRRLREAEARR